MFETLTVNVFYDTVIDRTPRLRGTMRFYDMPPGTARYFPNSEFEPTEFAAPPIDLCIDEYDHTEGHFTSFMEARECSVCGALVSGLASHVEWHEALAS